MLDGKIGMKIYNTEGILHSNTIADKYLNHANLGKIQPTPHSQFIESHTSSLSPC
jgi:hypothetical protein